MAVCQEYFADAMCSLTQESDVFLPETGRDLQYGAVRVTSAQLINWNFNLTFIKWASLFGGAWKDSAIAPVFTVQLREKPASCLIFVHQVLMIVWCQHWESHPNTHTQTRMRARTHDSLKTSGQQHSVFSLLSMKSALWPLDRFVPAVWLGRQCATLNQTDRQTDGRTTELTHDSQLPLWNILWTDFLYTQVINSRPSRLKVRPTV